MMIDNLLANLGYQLIDDAWASYGRKTFIHDDDADRAHLAVVTRLLASGGWQKNPGKLRSFVNHTDGEEIEIEPGGADVCGHFLHQMKIVAEVTS